MVSVPASPRRSKKTARMRQARPPLEGERPPAWRQVLRLARRSQVWPQLLAGRKYSPGRRFGQAVSRPLPRWGRARFQSAPRWQESGQLLELLVQELWVQSRLEFPEGPDSQAEARVIPRPALKRARKAER